MTPAAGSQLRSSATRLAPLLPISLHGADGVLATRGIVVSHGKQHVAMLFATLNLLAFAIHIACGCLEQLRINARTAERARAHFFKHITTMTAYLILSD